ncbi:MAG: GDSL-type esterase/lipase family protein [Candidatus Omnitrophota bacterium]
MVPKKLFILFPFLILCNACTPAIKNLNNEGLSVVCLGDSIASGSGVKKEESFIGILERKISKPIINSGIAGDTTENALRRIERDVLSKAPFLVIVELGGNDYLRKVPKSSTFRNLEGIIIKIQGYGAAVVLCDVSSNSILAGYNSGFKKLSKRTGSILVPRMMRGILDDPSKKSDFIHPNKEGHRLIAQRIYEEISKYFDF